MRSRHGTACCVTGWTIAGRGQRGKRDSNALAVCLLLALNLWLGCLPASMVTIGAGDHLSSIPMDFHWYSSLYECLYYPQELGFASATIDSLEFYNNFGMSPTNGATKIWMGTTHLTSLIEGMIPSGDLTLVFDGNVDYPSGTNTITIPLQTPYNYTPGNLVLMVHRPLDNHWYPGVNGFFSQIGTQPRSRMIGQDGYIDPAEPPESELSTWFPRTTVYYRSTPVNTDLACLGLNGSDLPPASETALYQASVVNNGLQAQSGYEIKLFDSEDNELASLAGGTIQPLQMVVHSFAWVPAAGGPVSLYARVFSPGDAIPDNDQSNLLTVIVLPEGVDAVTVGNGDMINRKPVDFSYPTSLCETLYYPGELGFESGTVTALAYYNRFAEDYPAEPVSIWMGSTNTADLSGGWLPSTQLSLVFDGTIDFPAGQNRIIIPLQTPYNHHFGNLVTLVFQPFSATYSFEQNWFRCQRLSQNRTLMRSDSSPVDPAAPPFGNLLDIFPKTTFFHRELTITNDLAAVSVSGNPLPSAGVASSYRVTVCNQGGTEQDDFQVHLLREGGETLGTIYGSDLGPSQIREYSFEWVPVAAGHTNLYGQVVLNSDDVPQNNVSPAFPVWVQTEGTVAVTVGNGGATGRVPVDMLYRSSLFETIYLATELNFSGELLSLVFYNDFVNNLPAKHTRIWLGETALSDLFTDWISSAQLTLVFDGNVDYPAGANEIVIPLQTLYTYGGGNLVLMAQRPLDAESYSSSDDFVAQNGSSQFRSRFVYSDNNTFDPVDPPNMFTTAMYPKTTFIFSTGSDNPGEELVPILSTLGRARPNPFHSASGTAIPVALKAGDTGTLSIYNVAGRLVQRFSLREGIQELSWDGRDYQERRCASGIYLYRLDSTSCQQTGKMVLLR